MSTDTRRIVFDFVGRDNVSRTTRQVGSEVEGLNGKLGKLGGMMGSTLKTGALSAAAGLTAAGGAAVVFGVKTAASMEQAQIGFTNMLGSAEKAQKFLMQLQKFAAATPFEFQDVQRGAQRLLAMGFAADKVVPTLTAIGDSVAAMGGSAEQIDQVTLAIGQMNAKQKISTEEMMQLTEVGIPAFQILADKMHMTVPELQDMMSQAQGVGASELFRKGGMQALLDGLEKGTKSFKGFGGMMAQQSKSLSGLWSTLKDNVSLALGNMITPFMPALKAGLNGLVGLTGKLSAGMKALTDKGKSAGREFMKGFNFGDKTGSSFKSMSQLRDLGSQVGAAWHKLSQVWKTDVLPELKSLASWFRDKIAPVLQKMWKEELKELIKGFAGIGREIAKHKDTWKRFFADLKDVSALVAQKLGPILAWVGKVVLKALVKYVELVIKSWAFMADHFSNVVKIFRKGWPDIVKWWGNISAATGKMKDVAVRAFGAMTKVFLDAVSKIISGAAKAFGWVPGLGPKLKAAAGTVERFKNETNASLAKLSKGKTVPVRIRATTTGGALFELGKGFVTRAAGGPIPHMGPGSSEAHDSVPALLRVNEHVWTPEEVKGVGGHQAVFRLRQAARKGLLKGYAAGGPVGSGFSVAVDAPSQAQMQSSVWGPINGGIMQIVRAMAKEIAKLSGGAGSVVAAARKMIGYPYSWGGGGKSGPSYGIGRGASTYGFDCSGLTQYAWWQGRHIDIGGVTNPQWANSHQIPGPKPGALGFPHGPGVHVMLASDKPGYVIQAPFTGSYVQEVQRSSPMWRWPNAAKFAHGGPVWGKARAGQDLVGKDMDSWQRETLRTGSHAGGQYVKQLAAALAKLLIPAITSAIRSAAGSGGDGGAGDGGGGSPWSPGSSSRWKRKQEPWTQGSWSPWKRETAGHGSTWSGRSSSPWQRETAHKAIWGRTSTADALFSRKIGLLGSGARREFGGPMGAGMPYLVGERGPEVIVPRGPARAHRSGESVLVVNGPLVEVKGHLIRESEAGRTVNDWLKKFQEQGGNVVRSGRR